MALDIEILHRDIGYPEFASYLDWPWGSPSFDVCEGGLTKACLRLALYKDGCGLDSNCTRSCQNATEIFSSMIALYNCLMYPTISSIILAGNLSRSGLEIANALGINGLEDITSEIKRIVNGCVDAYCDSNNSTGAACRGYYDIPIGYSNGVLTYNSTEVRYLFYIEYTIL